MAMCEKCGKIPMFGHNRSHSMRATPRTFQPNIMRRRIVVDGQPRRIYLCTRCLRTMSKAEKK